MEISNQGAEAWLVQLLQDLAAEPYYAEAWDMLKRVEQEIRSLAPTLQRAIKRVLCKWLRQWGTDKVETALDLIMLLDVKECLPDLLYLWNAIAQGDLSDPSGPHFDSAWLEHIDRVIERLGAPLPSPPAVIFSDGVGEYQQNRDQSRSGFLTPPHPRAERWLSTLEAENEQLAPACWEETLNLMEEAILVQPEPFQTEIRKTICRWLGLWDSNLRRVSLSIALSVRLRIVEACPQLIELRQALVESRKTDPLGKRYNFLWIKRLNEAIRALTCR